MRGLGGVLLIRKENTRVLTDDFRCHLPEHTGIIRFDPLSEEPARNAQNELGAAFLISIERNRVDLFKPRLERTTGNLIGDECETLVPGRSERSGHLYLIQRGLGRTDLQWGASILSPGDSSRK